jgi:hypothetical protein
LWTLPELLFCPRDKPITVYSPGREQTESMNKRNIAQFLDDREQVRELIDHYESTIHLTPLELSSIASQCLFRRDLHQKYPGDVSYALMGLMRRRPVIDTQDSAFKAFARLSLANDGDELLERLVYMQPKPASSWYDMDDDYGANLWDIMLRVQVAGLVDAIPGEGRTSNLVGRLSKSNGALVDHAGERSRTQIITLDGAVGATIQWDTIRPVALFKRSTILRTCAKVLVRSLPIWLLMGIVLVGLGAAFGGISTPLLVLGGIVLGAFGLPLFFLPQMLRSLYCGKFRSTQAMMYGMKGIPQDLGEIERLVFGMNEGGLRWSPHGSTLGLG